MYCPKCSQQQASEEIRFCSRCGFQFDGLKKLFDENQDALVTGEAERRVRREPLHKRDALLGASLMLVGAVAIALLTISAEAATPLQAVVIPLLLVWAATASLLLLSGHAAREVKKLFSRDASATGSEASPDLTALVSPARQNALPPAQSAPVSGLGAWRTNTAELAQPPSITEHTTDSLSSK
ncbi:MAG TPA: hypothetical protein VGB73_17535 [Pyrinomonadaceae bacterium]|jgi:hypothetical protein